MQNDPQVDSLACDMYTESAVLCGLALTAASPPPPQGHSSRTPGYWSEDPTPTQGHPQGLGGVDADHFRTF